MMNISDGKEVVLISAAFLSGWRPAGVFTRLNMDHVKAGECSSALVCVCFDVTVVCVLFALFFAHVRVLSLKRSSLPMLMRGEGR